nr:uncharacterized protein LOC121823992 isoform X2 [Peromyscus maniculatus bairdii]
MAAAVWPEKGRLVEGCAHRKEYGRTLRVSHLEMPKRCQPSLAQIQGTSAYNEDYLPASRWLCHNDGSCCVGHKSNSNDQTLPSIRGAGCVLELLARDSFETSPQGAPAQQTSLSSLPPCLHTCFPSTHTQEQSALQNTSWSQQHQRAASAQCPAPSTRGHPAPSTQQSSVRGPRLKLDWRS